MTGAAVAVAAVGVSIVTVGALLSGIVLAVLLKRAIVKTDVKHVAMLGCWLVLAVRRPPSSGARCSCEPW